MSVSVKTPRLGAPAGPASPGALSRARSKSERDRARPDDLIELSASTYNDQLQRFKVLDSDMPYLFRRGERADRQPQGDQGRGMLQDWGIAAAGGLSLIMRVESRDLTQE